MLLEEARLQIAINTSELPANWNVPTENMSKALSNAVDDGDLDAVNAAIAAGVNVCAISCRRYH